MRSSGNSLGQTLSTPLTNHFFSKIFFFFGCGSFLKSVLNLLQYCFCFSFFGCKACGILTPQPGIEPAPPSLKGKVLTTGEPEESPLLSNSDGKLNLLLLLSH